MKYPITLRDSTPYFEKYFLLCEESPEAYVSAFREAQIESRIKRRNGTSALVIITLGALTAWIFGFLHMIVMLGVIAASWGLLNWLNRHENALLDRTFRLALRGKNDRFQEYMWRYRDPSYIVR